jgi:hypothetical protein
MAVIGQKRPLIHQHRCYIEATVTMPSWSCLVCGAQNPMSSDSCMSCRFIKGATKESAEAWHSTANERPGVLSLILLCLVGMVALIGLIFLINLADF